MRCLAVLLALTAFARGEEGAPQHDELGFPITFNGDVITRTDVLRASGADESRIGNLATLRSERDQLLMDKILVRVGAIYDIEVSDQDVDDWIRREIDIRGGEVPFYEYLGQRGLTLARYRESVRNDILGQYIEFMLTRGFTPQRRLLPWRLQPTPNEVKLAYENDDQRHAASRRVRRIELVVDIDQKARSNLVKQAFLAGEGQAWIDAEIEKTLQPRVAEIRTALDGGTPFVDLAERQGVDVAAQRKEWVELPREESSDPGLVFLQTAAAGATSEPLRQATGYRFLHVVEVDTPSAHGVQDREVYDRYAQRIQRLRRRKADALLKLRALDSSDIRPAIVRDDLRGALLSALREANRELQALGLH